MKVELLLNDCNKQESLRSESVAGIGANLKDCKVNSWQHDTREATKPPWVATVHDAIKESGRVLPHPSACLPLNTSTGIRGWPMHYPDVHPGGMVGYHPTWGPIELLSLQNPINPVCTSTQSNLLTKVKRLILNRLRWGIPPSELQTWKQSTHRPSHPIFSTFPKLPRPASY
jgi:hypothetical protein